MYLISDMNTESIFNFTFLFAVYSFMGWIIESVYRSITQRKFINAGFLYGPFIPIYGFGALFVIILDHVLAGWHFFPKLIAYGFVLTAVEYSVSILFEKIICVEVVGLFPPASSICREGYACSFPHSETALALVFVTFIHPTVSRLAGMIDGEYISTASMH